MDDLVCPRQSHDSSPVGNSKAMAERKVGRLET